MTSSLTPAEIEFLAEDELVTIIPNFKHPEVEFISGNFGPFEPQVPVEVPLWLAISLKKRQQCQIQPPAWLDEDWLRQSFIEEKGNEGAFYDMPFHYQETASLLFRYAPEDMADGERIQAVLQDVQDVRRLKLRTGISTVLQDIQGGQLPSAVHLTGASAMEIASIRPFLLKSLTDFYRYSRMVDTGGNLGYVPPRQTGQGAVSGAAAAGTAAGAATDRQALFRAALRERAAAEAEGAAAAAQSGAAAAPVDDGTREGAEGEGDGGEGQEEEAEPAAEAATEGDDGGE